MNLLKYKIINTPVGQLKIVSNQKALLAILWDNERLNRVMMGEMIEDTRDPVVNQTEKQLKEYFDKKRAHFDIPIELHGTSFQKKVWEQLGNIPYGETCAYKDIACNIGQPTAGRAVGAAVGRNPISIILPCHRVIATNGKLTGFAGGLDRKEILLALEKQT